jgi:hypothetical protein
MIEPTHLGPLAFPCPRCHAKPGEKCKGKPPCPDRGKAPPGEAPKPSQQPGLFDTEEEGQ